MTDLTYEIGTVSVAVGGTVVTGAGGMLWASEAVEYDAISIAGRAPVPILGVTDNAHLVIAPWAGSVASGAVYVLYQTSPLRFEGADYTAKIKRLLTALETTGFYWFVPATATVPDPSYGEEGQFARQAATRKEWLKTSGVWVYQGIFNAASYTDVVTIPGATQTLLDADSGKLFQYNSASAVAVSIAQPGGGAFLKGWLAPLKNFGAGEVTITPTTGTINGEASVKLKTGQSFVLYSDGTNWQVFRTKVHADDIDGSTAAKREAIRKTIYAAPFDAAAYNGMNQNGGMQISQENGSTAVAFASGSLDLHVVDGAKVQKQGTSVLSCSQATITDLKGHTRALKITTSTPQATIGSDFVFAKFFLEGYAFRRMSWGTADAGPVTASCWIKAPVAGIYLAQIINAASLVASTTTFTIATANVWQYVTLSFVAQTTGAWGGAAGVGAILCIFAAHGSYTNGVGIAGDFYITGLSVLPGNVAPSADESPYIIRAFADELLRAQRYFRPFFFFHGIAVSTGSIYASYSHQGMRATPTALAKALISATDFYVTNVTQSAASMSIVVAGNLDAQIYGLGNFAGLTIGRAYGQVSPTGLFLDARMS